MWGIGQVVTGKVTPVLQFPKPKTRKMSDCEKKYYKVLRAVMNAQHNAGKYFPEG